MNERLPANFADIRHAMARFSPAPKVEPEDIVLPAQVFMPESHRSVLDLERQLVVGNRGMGKSFWTRALVNKDVCRKIAVTYGLPKLARTEVVVGFNGSEKLSVVAPTPDAIRRAMEGGSTADEIWRSVMFRAVRKVLGQPENEHLDSTLAILKAAPSLFEETLSVADNSLASTGKTILILFDALDRLAADWTQIRVLTVSLLRRALGLKSFQSFRTKIFIRPDQFSDPNLFRFPDASKLKNEHVDLSWHPKALFDLLFFEIRRDEKAGRALDAVASEINAHGALISRTHFQLGPQDDQRLLINALAGSYMGTNARRGRVYTWVPLHLSDAHGACSPRTFLTAWQKGAEQGQAPTDRAVDHLGLIEGVRRASSARLEELREDYFWIDAALGALKGYFVPIEKHDLLELWFKSKVVQNILHDAAENKRLMPVELDAAVEKDLALLEAMKSIAVIEERANGKINVPDIFRVEAGIKRKGGVAVPRRT